MKTEPAGAEETRPPLASEGRGRKDRLALWSAGVPFRLKVAIVWGVIFLIILGFFSISGFDFQWMRDNVRFIAGGLQYTLLIAISGIVLAVILALLGALGRLSTQPDRLSGERVLHVVLPRHAADRADVPDLPGAAADRDQHLGEVHVGTQGARAHPDARGRRGRRAGAGTELRGLHDRDLPRRHPVGGSRAGRGCGCARDDAIA